MYSSGFQVNHSRGDNHSGSRSAERKFRNLEMAHNADAGYVFVESLRQMEEHPLTLELHPDAYIDLQIDQRLKQSVVDVSQIDFDKATFTGRYEDKEQVQNLLKDLEKKLIRRTVHFDNHHGLSELIFDRNGEVYEQIRGFLQKKGGVYHLEICKVQRNIACCKIFSFIQSVCDKVAYHVEKAFDKHEIGKRTIHKPLKDFIQNWEQRKKLKVITDVPASSPGSVLIYCTADLSVDLTNLIGVDDSKVIPLEHCYASFLHRHGQELLQKEASRLSVKASLDQSNNTLHLEGDNNKREQFKSHLMTIIHKEYFSLPSSSSPKHLSRLFDPIADDNECTWTMCLLDQPETYPLPGCDYLMTVYHPTHPGTLSCITGDITTLKVDALILLVTDTLCPLPNFQGANELSSPNPGSMHYLGECMFNRQCGSIIQLVVERANSYSPFTGLSTTYMERALKAVDQNNCKTVCLPVCDMIGNLTPDAVVKVFVDVLIKANWKAKNVQVYLCFDPQYKDVEKNCELVEGLYQKANRGFSRKFHQKNKAGGFKNNQVNIQVVEGSLQQITTEAIVNPSRPDLDLTKGFVSKSLLQAAGQELQSSCKWKYPDGISPGEVAVTPPFKLKEINKNLKTVLHCALPRFNISTVHKDIKKIMRHCLLKAEEEYCTSIAFPILGTGNHGNPNRETIKVMYDAVEEYRDESFNPRVETIVFTIPDDESKRAFRNEKELRSQKSTFISYIQGNLDCDHLEGTYKKDLAEVSIVFGQSFKSLPTYVVEVNFRKDMNTDWNFKFSTEEPVTIFDQLSLKLKQVSTDKETMKTGMKTCFEYCQLNRITEIILDLNAVRGLHTSDYYQTVVDVILEIVKSCSGSMVTLAQPCYIHKVYIKVFEHQMSMIEKHFIQGKSVVPAIFRGSNFVWQKYSGNLGSKPVQVEILGKSRESVVQTKTEMLKVLKSGWDLPANEDLSNSGTCTDYERFGAKPKTKYIGGASSNDKGLQGTNRRSGSDDDTGDKHDDSDDDHVDKDDDHADGDLAKLTVSAEINSGFIKFKKNFNDLKRWLRKVETEFEVKVETKSNQAKPEYRATGNYRQISLLKYYLDYNFPNDPSSDMQVPEDPADKLKNEIRSAVQEQKEVQEDKDSAPAETLIEMEEYKARAVMKLYSFNEISGLKKWEYNSDRRGLSVTYENTDKPNLETEIRRKFNALYKKECDFHDDPDSFMLAENVVLDMGVESQAYFGVIPQESKIVIFGKDDKTAQGALEELLSKVKGDLVEAVPSTLGDSEHGHFIQMRENKIKVWIYCSDITKLSVEAVAIPANKSPKKIQGIQKIVLEAAGQSVKDEYIYSLTDQGLISQGDCRKTLAGSLPYRHLFHVYLPQLQKKRDDISANNLLEEVLVTVLTAADEERHISIGLPFIGSGNAGYQLEICAQQYFRAVNNKDWEPKYLQEIHFVSNNEDQVETVSNLFQQCVKDSLVTKHDTADGGRQKSDDKETSSDFFLIGGQGKVKLYVSKGHVAAVQVDAIACHQNKHFTKNHGIVKQIYTLCGKDEENWLGNEKGKAHDIDTVYGMPVKGGDLTCRGVLHVVLLEYMPHIKDKFKKTLENITFNILSAACNRGYKSIALPLLGWEGNEKTAVTQFRCEAMVKGIFKYAYESPGSIREIHVLDENDDVVRLFREQVSRWENVIAEAQNKETRL